MATYPNGVPALIEVTPTTPIEGHAANHNDVNAEVEAIAAELGVLPKGTDADVRTRLDRVDATAAGAQQAADDALQGVVDNTALISEVTLTDLVFIEYGTNASEPRPQVGARRVVWCGDKNTVPVNALDSDYRIRWP